MLTAKMQTSKPMQIRMVKNVNPILPPTFYRIGPTNSGRTMFGNVGTSTNHEY